MSNRRILLLAADRHIWDSLAGLLRLDGAEVVATVASAPDRIDLVVLACDCWPARWSSRALRSTFRRTPCLLLSGSPVFGPYTASALPRGFFAPLPMSGAVLAGLVATLLA